MSALLPDFVAPRRVTRRPGRVGSSPPYGVACGMSDPAELRSILSGDGTRISPGLERCPGRRFPRRGKLRFVESPKRIREDDFELKTD